MARPGTVPDPRGERRPLGDGAGLEECFQIFPKRSQQSLELSWSEQSTPASFDPIDISLGKVGSGLLGQLALGHSQLLSQNSHIGTELHWLHLQWLLRVLIH